MTRPTAGFNAYTDIRQIWDAACSHGGARYACTDYRAATQLVQRMNTYRVMVRKRDGITQMDEFKVIKRGNIVLVEPHRITGLLTTLEGAPIDLDQIRREQTAHDLEWAKAEGYIDPDKPLDLDK